MRGPGYPAGVPTPYAMHVHPYPTRFHGGIWTRPVFGFPSQQQTSTVFIPGRDIEMQPDKPYTGGGVQGLGGGWDVGQGVFQPGGYGGGVFDGNLAGAPALGKRGKSTLGDVPETATESDKTNYPYGKYSAQTLLLQQGLNKYMATIGMCPLIADGKLGAATCGASIFRPAVDGNAGAPTTCEDFKTPAKSPNCGTNPISPTTTSVSNKPTAAAISASLPMSSSTKKVLGFVAGGVAAIGLVYYMKKRRR